MVDSRGFYDVHTESVRDSRAQRLGIHSSAVPREDLRGKTHKSIGRMRLSNGGHSLLFDTVVCEHGTWALTLITDVAPPMRKEFELEWEDDSGTLKHSFGKVTGTRHGNRVKDASPDMFFSRFELSA